MRSTILLLVMALFIVMINGMCPCPRNYDPLCASDGNTYNNRCLFECEERKQAAKGTPITIVRAGPCLNNVLRYLDREDYIFY